MGSHDQYGRRAPWMDAPGTHNQTVRVRPGTPFTEPCSLCGRLARGGFAGCCGVRRQPMPREAAKRALPFILSALLWGTVAAAWAWGCP